jgi:hypothetical protein
MLDWKLDVAATSIANKYMGMPSNKKRHSPVPPSIIAPHPLLTNGI